MAAGMSSGVEEVDWRLIIVQLSEPMRRRGLLSPAMYELGKRIEKNMEAIREAALISGFLPQRGYPVRQISRSGMGSALVRFSCVVDRDMAIGGSPYFIGDSV